MDFGFAATFLQHTTNTVNQMMQSILSQGSRQLNTGSITYQM